MNFKKCNQISLRIYGAIVFVAALVHGVWNWFLPTYPVMEGLTQTQWSFIHLLNWSVTILLLFFAIMAFGITSEKFAVGQMRMFAIVMAGFWTWRLILEFIYPLQVPFIIIPNPSLFIKILILLCITILLLPGLLHGLRSHQNNKNECCH